MGSRGSFLKEGGFSSPPRWRTVDYIDGIKVLEPKNPASSVSLPERANTPGTTYVSFRKSGDFDQLIKFDEKRMPVFEIDYGQHDGKKTLHVHYYSNGNRINNQVHKLKTDDDLYKKYKNIFRGVKL